jgi:4-aminobutyrate aminotransferase-like enzyme
VASAEGVWLHTSDGRRVLDLYGGHAVAALGYGHPGWTRALSEQARQLEFPEQCSAAGRAAARGGSASSVLPTWTSAACFSSTAAPRQMRMRLKMAFTITGRSHVAAIEHGFPWPHRGAGADYLGGALQSGMASRARPSM